MEASVGLKMEIDSAPSGWVTTRVRRRWSAANDSDNSNNMVRFLMSPPKCTFLEGIYNKYQH